jgi:hypothetical protein
MRIKKELEEQQGIEVVKKENEGKKQKCPVCGKELVLIRSYSGYKLKKVINKYLIDGSPPEHGKIYERRKTAA